MSQSTSQVCYLCPSTSVFKNPSQPCITCKRYTCHIHLSSLMIHECTNCVQNKKALECQWCKHGITRAQCVTCGLKMCTECSSGVEGSAFCPLHREQTKPKCHFCGSNESDDDCTRCGTPVCRSRCSTTYKGSLYCDLCMNHVMDDFSEPIRKQSPRVENRDVFSSFIQGHPVSGASLLPASAASFSEPSHLDEPGMEPQEEGVPRIENLSQAKERVIEYTKTSPWNTQNQIDIYWIQMEGLESALEKCTLYEQMQFCKDLYKSHGWIVCNIEERVASMITDGIPHFYMNRKTGIRLVKKF